MICYIETMNDNGSGMRYKSKEDLLAELSRMIDDCQKNGGTFMDFQINSDVIGKTRLGNAKPGEIIKIGDREYIVLEHDDNVFLILQS